MDNSKKSCIDDLPMPDTNNIIDMVLLLVLECGTAKGIAEISDDGERGDKQTVPFIMAPCTSPIAIAIIMLHKLGRLTVIKEHYELLGTCNIMAKINNPSSIAPQVDASKIAPSIMEELEGLLKKIEVDERSRDRNKYKGE